MSTSKYEAFSYETSPIDLGPQVDHVNPDSLDFHSRGFQVLGLIWVSLEELGGGGTTARDWSSIEYDWRCSFRVAHGAK